MSLIQLITVDHMLYFHLTFLYKSFSLFCGQHIMVSMVMTYQAVIGSVIFPCFVGASPTFVFLLS